MSRLTDAVRRYVQRTDLDRGWREAALFSRSAVELTATELAELQDEYLDLVRRWTDSARDTSAGTRSGAARHVCVPRRTRPGRVQR